MEKQADIGLIGLAVMGQNLVLNMSDRGFVVAVFNRTVSKVTEFMEDAAQGRGNILPAYSLQEFLGLLKRPRKVMLMVKAGEAVDQFIEHLVPLLESGDIIIDGGNSYFSDSNRRFSTLIQKGLFFVGMGVSGGEEGARFGPSLMPGGAFEAWPFIRPIFQAIAARTDQNEPCCDWVGEAGSGHYVKMIHNGIEYGDMQLIAEAYHLMRDYLKLSPSHMRSAFEEWNKGELNSYLVEIFAHILGYFDNDGAFVLETILDVAGQKGTGKWTAIEALNLGVPVTLIGEAVFARCLSVLKQERAYAATIFPSESSPFTGDLQRFLQDLGEALLAAKIISYSQGFMLMREAAQTYQWNLNYGSVALMWRGGCIIRSAFLQKIKESFHKNPQLQNIMLDEYFSSILNRAQASWRRILCEGVSAGIPLPALSTAMAFFDGYRTERLPAHVLQALRDYFGAHMYERVDRPRGEFFHTDWAGTGGKSRSSVYDA